MVRVGLWFSIALCLASACRRVRFCDPAEQDCDAPLEVTSGVAGKSTVAGTSSGEGTVGGTSSAAPSSGAGGARTVAGAPGASAGEGGEPAGTGGAGGDANDGGASDGSPCQLPAANCDESMLNGCETNLDTNPLHCGRCGRRCSGACGANGCLEFDVVSERPVLSWFPFALTSEHVVFVAPVSTPTAIGVVSLERMSKHTRAIETLLTRDNEISNLQLSFDRIYFTDPSDLRSIAFSGLGGLRDEGVPSPSAFASAKDSLYWIEGSTLKRRSPEGMVEQVPFPFSNVRLQGYPGDALIAVSHFYVGFTADPTYRIHAVREWPEVILVAEGRGQVLRAHNTIEGFYWLVQTGQDEERSTEILMKRSFAESLITTAASGTTFLDFVVDWGALLVVFHDRYGSGLRVISPEVGVRFEYGTDHPLESLDYDEEYLWFHTPFPIEPSNRLLARIPVDDLARRK